MELTLQRVLVPTGESGDAYLVFYEGWLLAIFVCLSELQGENAGAWFLEKGFDALDRPNSPLFADLDAAKEWVRTHLADSPRLAGITPATGQN